MSIFHLKFYIKKRQNLLKDYCEKDKLDVGAWLNGYVHTLVIDVGGQLNIYVHILTLGKMFSSTSELCLSRFLLNCI